MQRNNQLFTFFDLPNDVTEKIISNHLSIQQLTVLSQANSYIKTQFKDALHQEKLNLLLTWVAQGKEEQVEKALNSNPELLFDKGTIIDDAGREFRHITAFQYAIWALDKHMWTLLLNYLPSDIAKNQLYEHEFCYAEYKVTHGHHYDFSPLLNGLKVYTETCHLWDYDLSIDFWCKQIGGAQRALPNHVAHEYCRENMRFDAITFKQDNLPRNTPIFQQSNWFSVSDTNLLGRDFAFLLCDEWGAARLSKTLWAGSSMFAGQPYRSHAWLNWKFINELASTRYQEYLELRRHLLRPNHSPSMSVR